MAYRNSSKHVPNSSGTSTVIPVPANDVGDIVVAWIYKENTATVSAPSGFTLKDQDTASATTAGAWHVYWKRLTSVDTGSYTFSWTGSAWRSGYAATFSGRVTTGDPFVSTAKAFGNTASLSLTGLSALGGEDGFAAGQDWNGMTTASFSGGGTWTNRQLGDDVRIASQDNISAGGLGTVTYTDNGGGQKKAFIGLLAPAPSGISLDLTVVTESGLIVPLSALKSKDVAPTAETDIAITLAGVKARDVAVVSETDVPVALASTKSKSLATISESDTPVALSASKSKDLGTVSETGTVIPVTVTGPQLVSLNTIVETDTVQPLAATKSVSVNTIAASELPVGLQATKARSLAQVSETDAVVALLRGKSRSVSIVTETDSVITLSRRKDYTLSSVLELDEVVALSGTGGVVFTYPTNPTVQLDAVTGVVVLDEVPPSSVQLEAVAGSVQLDAVAGAIELDALPESSVQLNSITGSVVLDG